MNRTHVRRVVLFLAAGIAVLALTAGCGNDHDAGGMENGSGSTASATATAAFNDADVSFAQNMIVHHQQAVEMAGLAETRAGKPEIKKLAADIKAAQQPEIDKMTGWLNAWGKPITPAGGHGSGHAMPGMMSEPEMSKLKSASGADFDRQFARMMIAHHNGAIEMAREVQGKGSKVEVKKLAGEIEKSQSAEVQTLQKLLDQM
jgi:uncharacterized protein (DUF305 family)